MFSKVYIELCRELALCDWRGPGGKGWPPDARWVPRGGRRPRMVVNAGAPFKNEGATWLPREGDWLDLLEAEGYYAVCFDHDPDAEGGPYFAFGDDDKSDPYGDGPDRLTALARLYAAVTGKP